MTAIHPGAMLGILGGGQLGRMFAQAAKRLGYRVAVLEPSADSPAGQIADVVLQAPYTDEKALQELSEISAAVTYEFENVDVSTVTFLERLGKPVHPSANALRISQDRILEKSFVRDAGIPVTPFAPIRIGEDVALACEKVGFPAFLKTARGGYDGKGQVRVENIDELIKAQIKFGNRDLILEKVVPFDLEMSVVACRGQEGSFVAYPPAENQHSNGILDISLMPGRASASTFEAAYHIARIVGNALDFVGTFCVELFVLKSGEVLLNEIAPRPHNSGHITIDNTICSQFEQQLRALCGLPLGSTQVSSAAAMVNILGNGEGDQLMGVEDLLRDPNVSLHLYGKKHAVKGRKMGHFTVLAQDVDHAMARAKNLRTHLHWEK